MTYSFNIRYEDGGIDYTILKGRDGLPNPVEDSLVELALRQGNAHYEDSELNEDGMLDLDFDQAHNLGFLDTDDICSHFWGKYESEHNDNDKHVSHCGHCGYVLARMINIPDEMGDQWYIEVDDNWQPADPSADRPDIEAFDYECPQCK